MKKNKITITYTKGKGFNISTVSNNTPMRYTELKSLMYDMANALAEFDRDANNECEENAQMTESDCKMHALQLLEKAHTETNIVRLAKVMMECDEPFDSGTVIFFRTIAGSAFLQGWNSCLDNFEAVKEFVEEKLKHL